MDAMEGSSPGPSDQLQQASPAESEYTVEQTYQDPMVEDEYEEPASATLDEGYQTGRADANAEGSPRPVDGMTPSRDDALQFLGREVKRLMETITDLRQLGVEDLVLPLPRVVVVGDQSAGKSSLIEALSEIKVPRKSGCCTKCPLEINVTEGATPESPWICRVSLRYEYAYDPRGSYQSSARRGASDRRKQNLFLGEDSNEEFEHFRRQEPEERFFKEIHRKEELEKVLDMAQEAIIHPNDDPKTYVPGADGNAFPKRSKPKLKFSPNIVRLDISGPGLTNLSFCDLPGLINRPEELDEGYLVDTVRNLAKRYIQKHNCLVLLAQSMHNDAGVSTAAGLVMDLRAEDKCIGVLTKPDLFEQTNDLETWRAVLKNDKFALKHGYFVTKQPNQNQLQAKINHAQARAEEDEFFKVAKPWSTEFKPFEKKFGTRQLQKALSGKLTWQILDSLPNIESKVRQKAELVETELQMIPDPPANNLSYVLGGKLTLFKKQIEDHIGGGYGHNSFQKSWNALVQHFRLSVLHSRPTINFKDFPKTPRKLVAAERSVKANPSAPSTPTPLRHAPRSQTITLSDDDEPPKAAATPQSRKRNPQPVPATPNKRAKVDAQGVDYGSFMGVRCMKPNTFPRVSANLSEAALAKKFTFEEIEGVLSDYNINGIPGLMDAGAISMLCLRAIQHWAEPMNIFLEKTAELIRNEVFGCVEDVFGIYRGTQLFDKITEIANSCLDEALNSQGALSAIFYEMEIAKRGTINEESHEAAKAEARTVLDKKRLEHRANVYLTELEERTGKLTEGQERANKVAKITAEQLGPDEHARGMDAMVQVRGYYKVAVNRFIDNLFLSTQTQCFTKIQKDLWQCLEQTLMLNEEDANERCKRLIEDPQREIRRASLTKDKATLNTALQKIADLSYS